MNHDGRRVEVYNTTGMSGSNIHPPPRKSPSLFLSYQQNSFPDTRHSPLAFEHTTCSIATFKMAAQTTEKLDQLDRKILEFSVYFSHV